MTLTIFERYLSENVLYWGLMLFSWLDQSYMFEEERLQRDCAIFIIYFRVHNTHLTVTSLAVLNFDHLGCWACQFSPLQIFYLWTTLWKKVILQNLQIRSGSLCSTSWRETWIILNSYAQKTCLSPPLKCKQSQDYLFCIIFILLIPCLG